MQGDVVSDDPHRDPRELLAEAWKSRALEAEGQLEEMLRALGGPQHSMLGMFVQMAEVLERARHGEPQICRLCVRFTDGRENTLIWVYATPGEGGPIERLSVVAEERNRLRDRVGLLLRSMQSPPSGP